MTLMQVNAFYGHATLFRLPAAGRLVPGLEIV